MLHSGAVQIERKHFQFALKENPRGRFLRIIEDTGGRFNSIVIPATGLAEFQKLLAEMIQADMATPLQTMPQQEDSANNGNVR